MARRSSSTGWSKPTESTPTWLPCLECPLVGGAGHTHAGGEAPKTAVVGTRVVGKADPTETYLLACGHVAL